MFSVGRTAACDQLSKIPPSSLIGISQLCSLGFQFVLIIAFQMIAICIVWSQSWYVPHVPTWQEDFACHDNYAVFAVSVFSI